MSKFFWISPVNETSVVYEILHWNGRWQQPTTPSVAPSHDNHPNALLVHRCLKSAPLCSASPTSSPRVPQSRMSDSRLGCEIHWNPQWSHQEPHLESIAATPWCEPPGQHGTVLSKPPFYRLIPSHPMATLRSQNSWHKSYERYRHNCTETPCPCEARGQAEGWDWTPWEA